MKVAKHYGISWNDLQSHLWCDVADYSRIAAERKTIPDVDDM